MLKYTIIGASGLIGSLILQELLDTTDAEINLVLRRPLGITNTRAKECIVDFTDQQAINQALAGSDGVFVAIGTTRSKVKGNTTTYRNVDYAIPIAIAKACIVNSISKLVLVSSVGANSQSPNFYLKLKGEVEDAISNMPIPFLGIFQPSLLLGARKEFRLGEKIGQAIMPLLSFVMPTQYKPIKASIVAKAMIKAVLANATGIHRYTYRDITSMTTS